MSERAHTADQTDIEITPEMIDAGVYAIQEHTLGEPLHNLVWKVYLAMRTEELEKDRSSIIDQRR